MLGFSEKQPAFDEHAACHRRGSDQRDERRGPASSQDEKQQEAPRRHGEQQGSREPSQLLSVFASDMKTDLVHTVTHSGASQCRRERERCTDWLDTPSPTSQPWIRLSQVKCGSAMTAQYPILV